jgi:putative acetyltransferase
MHPTPSIRRECAADIQSIRAVVEAAFGRSGEADLVDALRRADALVLSAVASTGDRIVGHIALSPVTVHSESSVSPALALAPVAVTPDRQRQGIGTALVRWALGECRRLGHEVVIVLGEPAYYHRFGFTPASLFGVACPFPTPPEAFMLLELAPDAAGERCGTVLYRPEFASL